MSSLIQTPNFFFFRKNQSQKTKSISSGLPPYSKRLLAAIIVVFPIVLAVNTFVGPMMENLPSLVVELIYVFFILPLMTLFIPIILKRM